MKISESLSGGMTVFCLVLLTSDIIISFTIAATSFLNISIPLNIFFVNEGKRFDLTGQLKHQYQRHFASW